MVVHFPPSARAAANMAVDKLKAAGLGEVSSVPVNMTVGQSNVRFFHAADGPAAARVAEALPPSRPGDAPESRDFTDFSPKPVTGRLEVWLAGESPGGTAAAPRRAAATRPVASAPRGTAASEIERILVERTVQQMLRDLRD